MRKILQRIVVISLLAVPPVSGTAATELSNLKALAAKNVAISAIVVDISKGRILAQHNADTNLIPASVTKLLIDAAALDRFGPDHRFSTKLVTNGKISNSTLEGDLIFIGGGDPGLTTDHLWQLVMRLRQSGIDEITGDLVIDNSLFGNVPCFSKDRCEALKASSNGYDAPLSGAGVNHSAIEIRVHAGDKNGAPASIALFPPSLVLDMPLEGSITTTTQKKRPLYGVRRTTRDGEDKLHAYGQVPYGGGPYHIYRAISDPAKHTGRVFAALLRDAGIDLDGEIRVTMQPLEGKTTKLGSIESDELSQILRSMMIYSNNYMADLLTLHLLDSKDPRPVSLPDAGKKLQLFVEKINASAPAWLELPDKNPGLVIDSGSGLTPSNRMAARDLVATLVHMHDRPELFPSFVSSLSIPRSAPSRMLRRAGNRDWMTRLAVKTGYLSVPVTVLSLSGYFRLKDGGWGAFAAITNGTKKRRSVSSRLSMQAIRKDLEAIMAKH